MTVPTLPPDGPTGEPTSKPSPRIPSPAALQARGGTLVVTNLIKLGGLAGAVNEMLFRSELRPLAVALCGVMLLGAQLSEDLMLRALDRFLGRDADTE